MELSPLEFKVPEPGEIVASGRIGKIDREYTFLQKLVRPSNERFDDRAGSISSEWVPIGYELCSRAVGSKHWVPEKTPKVNSLREAIISLAENLDIPERALIHPTAITWRNDLRQELDARTREEAAEEAAGIASEEASESPGLNATEGASNEASETPSTS